MASFEKAQMILEQIEGGYVHDPLDRGGETVNGIARKHFPNWEGWSVIDRLKNNFKGDLKALKSAIAKDKELHNKIKAFYKSHFWNKMKLSEIDSQVIADNIYLFGVNAGISRSVKFAQKIAGVAEDGVMGKMSLQAINNIPEKDFKKAFDALEVEFYQGIVKKNPSQVRFLKGWLNRADLV